MVDRVVDAEVVDVEVVEVARAAVPARPRLTILPLLGAVTAFAVKEIIPHIIEILLRDRTKQEQSPQVAGTYQRSRHRWGRS